jgi:hypothetical protein
MFPYGLFSNESVHLQKANKITSIQSDVLNEERHLYFIDSQLISYGLSCWRVRREGKICCVIFRTDEKLTEAYSIVRIHSF